MNSKTNLKTNDMNYVLKYMEKEIHTITPIESITDFFEFNDIENPIINASPSLIIKVMDGMIWPKMGIKQSVVNKKALTSFNVVVRYFKKEAKYIIKKGTIDFNRRQTETIEAIKVQLRIRGFSDP